ncbi:MAG: hypothetical protein AABX88_00610 [Nanoarchaeota archaeon]
MENLSGNFEKAVKHNEETKKIITDKYFNKIKRGIALTGFSLMALLSVDIYASNTILDTPILKKVYEAEKNGQNKEAEKLKNSQAFKSYAPWIEKTQTTKNVFQVSNTLSSSYLGFYIVGSLLTIRKRRKELEKILSN